jgi:hypothetical protein
LGALIGGITLATGALRNAATAIEGNKQIIPPEVVLVYGAYFTVLVALVYAPTYVTLQTTGRNLQDSVLPMPSPASQEWETWCKKRQGLEEVLRLEKGGTQSFQTSFAILAPLAGSIISILLKGGS